MELINALPHPVSLSCFLESLDRPLSLEATRSVISLQPAAGRRSPRLFLLFGTALSLSVVPEGAGSALLEFGEFVEPAVTVKGEVEFPVAEPLDAAAPYRHLASERGTSCGGCHAQEQVAFTLGDVPAFKSEALRPAPSLNVTLQALQEEVEKCDRILEPGRCALLDAIFEHGEVKAGAFPNTLLTIFD